MSDAAELRDSGWSDWIGRQEERHDVLEPARSEALSVSLGPAAAPAEVGVLPLLHHWLYFWEVTGRHALGEDGHPLRGGFLPPIAAPRRMWAGGRVRFHQPLRFGQAVRRVSTVDAISSKIGRSGALVFVAVRHALFCEERLALEEVQELVFLQAPRPSASQPAQAVREHPDTTVQAWREHLIPDPILLFRYSGLTMNSHRIHYDRSYATNAEGYGGLVVHGPLQATLLIGLAARRRNARLSEFSYRGLYPTLDTANLTLCGRPTEKGAELWVEQAGLKTFSAQALLGRAEA